MRKSRLSLSKQERPLEHFVAGATARCAADLVGVHRNRLRELIAISIDEPDQFAGEIEVNKISHKNFCES